MNSPLTGSIVPRIRLHLEMDWQLSRDWLHLLKWNLKSLRVGVPIFPPLKKENWIIKVEIKKNNERIQPLYLRQNYSLLKQTIDILIKGLMNRKWNGLLKVIKVIKVIYKEQRPHV